MDKEKNAIPNDMAKRGWRLMESTGANTGRSHAVSASAHEAFALGPDGDALALVSGGGQQNVVHQVGGRLDFGQRFQPAPSRIGFREQRAADRADPGMGLKAFQLWPGQRPVEGFDQQRVKLRALHAVFGFACHHITCLYVRCSRRASSARPRFILDFTVPSGTFSTVAMSL